MLNLRQFVVCLHINSSIVSQMAEENYEVMISSKEYNQIRLCQKERAQLSQKLKNATQKLQESASEVTSLTEKLNTKKAQNSYLLQQIQSILAMEALQAPTTLQTGKSAVFEVLGQSMFQPERKFKRTLNPDVHEFHKKHSVLVDKISIFVKQQQQKDEQITELNQIVAQRDKFIVKLKAINDSLMAEQASDIPSDHKNRHERKTAQKDGGNNSNKPTNAQKEAQLAKCQAENAQLQKQLKNSKTLVEKHREQNNKLNGLLKEFSERTKSLENQIQSLKNGMRSSPKVQTIIKVKAMIDAHIGEVEKNLKSIEGLSSEEIKNLVRLEMKELVQYISKAIQNKK